MYNRYEAIIDLCSIIIEIYENTPIRSLPNVLLVLVNEFDIVDSNDELFRIIGTNNITSDNPESELNILNCSLIIPCKQIVFDVMDYIVCCISDENKLTIYKISPSTNSFIKFDSSYELELTSYIKYEKIRKQRKDKQLWL